jgi:hemerythrin superfamily protein
MADKQDAITLLREDHDKVEKLFKDYEEASGDGRKEKIARQICRELTVHAMIEEEIFYPAIKGKVDDELLEESFVEHDAAKLLIAEIESGGPDEDFYDAKVKVLKEEIEHHVEEEEMPHKGLFAQSRKTDIDMKALGERMAARKAELMEQAESGELPQPELTTMNRPGA